MSESFSDLVPLFHSFRADLRRQPVSDWTGPFDLPSELVAMYLDLGPIDVEIPSVGNPVYVPKLARLWSYQEGYRWHGLTKEPLTEWQHDLLVVADLAGDPVVLSMQDQGVSVGQHGLGHWAFEPLSASLLPAITGLGVVGEYVANVGWAELVDDNDTILPEHVDTARSRIAARAGDDVACRLLAWLDWIQ